MTAFKDKTMGELCADVNARNDRKKKAAEHIVRTKRLANSYPALREGFKLDELITLLEAIA